MNIQVKMKLNDRMEVTGTFDGEDFQDAVKNAGIFLEMDGQCGLCSGTDIFLQTRVSKDGNKFTEYTCRKCRGRRPIGKLKAGGYFLKPWEPMYQGKTEGA